MAQVVWAWPLKRAVFARLAKVAAGQIMYDGATALVSTTARPVQTELYLPAEPERICVYGLPLSFSRREVTGESQQWTTAQSVAVGQVEQVRLEIAVRVYEPGEDFDVVDRTLSDTLSAVLTAVLAESLLDTGRIYLSGGTQTPTALAPAPEPSVTATASLTFTAEVLTF